MMRLDPAEIARRREAARNRVTGEFGEQSHSAPTHLPTFDDRVQQQVDELLAARVAQLRQSGYVQAGTIPDVFDPNSTKRRDQWWANSFALAEQAKGGGVHVMPDDYTPGMTGGQSLTGHRRTYRAKYEVGGVAMRMPSRAAIHRYAKGIEGRPFDVPVEATYPGGSVQGYVRVQPGPDGRWLAEPVGMDAQVDASAYAYVGEAVNAVLESRRVRMELGAVSDLMERRRLRRAQLGERMYVPKAGSGWVEQVGYSQVTETLLLRLRGRAYAYSGVSEQQAQELLSSPHPGRYYNKVIKGSVGPAMSAVECGACGRWCAQGVSHVCPPVRGSATRTMKYERLLMQRALGVRAHRSMARAMQRARSERWLG